MTTKHLTGTTLSLLALTLFSGSLLISSTTSAEDESVVDEVNITVPVSCSLSGTGMSSHTANIVNGTYQANIGTTTLKAFCNDTNGFAIYANGYTGNTLGNNKLIGSSTSSEIVTGTATTAGSPDVSNWAMKLEPNSSATYALTLDNGFGSYSSVPSSYTKVAHRDSGTDLGTSAEGATLTSTYAAYISKTQPSDTYEGKVKYTLVHPASEEPAQPVPCEPGKICYQPNTSSVQGQMGKQSASNNANITLYAPNFKRAGYGFAGWNTKYDYTGTNYGPNQTITAPADVATSGLSLYAMWISSQGTLQNWNGCSSMNIGDVTALTDNRDNDTYAVAKLADGKCWTIENLRLSNKDNNMNDIILSSTNTHNPVITTFSSPTDPTVNTWCVSDSSACYDQTLFSINNTVKFVDNIPSSYNISSNIYSYGNYYNWYSATAGHGTYNKSSGNTTGDICPAGWHLPIGDTLGEFNSLNTALSGNNTDSIASNNIRSFPNNFVYSGTGSGGGSVAGYYWSTSAYGTNYGRLLSFGDSGVAPGTDTIRKRVGHVVRCIAGV